jgi:hypothetical protein
VFKDIATGLMVGTWNKISASKSRVAIVMVQPASHLYFNFTMFGERF